VAARAEHSGQTATDTGRQCLFRIVNERIKELAEPFELTEMMAIFCECGQAGCAERIELAEAEYERLRLIPTHFAVLAGHNIPAAERVVEENSRFLVVEKVGQCAVEAVKLDPRRHERSGSQSSDRERGQHGRV
jgi:hypothetical protein